MDAVREKDHLLALKVMRLTKPTLMTSSPVLCDGRDLPSSLLNDAHLSDISVNRSQPLLGLSDLLTLPQNFGNIFLGETFSSYISVHNDSGQTVADILVKVDLQTSSLRLTLSGGGDKSNGQELEPDKSIDDVIHHEVKELGTHILVCAVSYEAPGGERMYFRKFFKFQVLKPLDVKTKFYNAESDEVYLEAQIQNITPTAIFMERVELEPSPHYTATQLNTMGDESVSVFGKVNYMTPMDVRQYLYCLTPRQEQATHPRSLKGVTSIGKMDIVWKTNVGERGRLQTSQLQRVAPGYGDVRLTVEESPDMVALQTSFQLTCRVANCSERAMELRLGLEGGTQAVQWCGTSGRSLGRLGPGESINVELQALALKVGLQMLTGLRLLDPYLKRTYEFDDVAQVFVFNEPCR